jgi:predicted metal-dependent HD superfamily phosphohydrolase
MANRISISKTFDWYLTEIMPVVEKYAIQQKGGYHGLYTHTAAVVFRGIDYALALGQDPTGVVLACAFHDMVRTHDCDDLEHGINAIPLANCVMDDIGNIDANVRDAIIFAIKNHSLNIPAPDYISQCMWDADRTRLSWECGYYPKFFATERAKVVAAGTPKLYLEFMHKNMSPDAEKIVELGENY